LDRRQGSTEPASDNDNIELSVTQILCPSRFLQLQLLPNLSVADHLIFGGCQFG
jgi:hypothetical protein